MKVLAEQAVIKVDGKRRILTAVLVTALGGHRVVYFDKDGIEIYSEPAGTSQFKDLVRKIKSEEGN